ncbi:hypothetical protein [Halalkalibacter hemicellulosilyticus]|uniref:Uncharacterized protein n=1 Tax=Halalkalibacter hemicellulosilyticusJCM 9152 TaxID=1236971 RepID=W4QCR2_9BACI|nr:hypothetical protein [Halalkalibacter hemicellulosilyticus]GAE29747.1 hypothetical protein JCM9152_1127 [Halalkalibacter hemicellulosilyticusJCM 9152]
MKAFFYLLQTNSKLAIFSTRFLYCIGFVALAMFIVSFGFIQPGQNVMQLLSLALGGTTGILMLTLGTLPILPFAISYATDWEQKVTSFWMIRSGVFQYALNKCLISAVSAFLVTSLGIALFIGIMSTWLPVLSIDDGIGAYHTFLVDGKLVLYFFFHITHFSLSSVIFAIIALWVSTMIPNKFVALATPVVLYFVAHRLTTTLDIPVYLKALTIVEGYYDAGSPFLSLSIKLATVMAITLLLSYLSIRNIKRRAQHD